MRKPVRILIAGAAALIVAGASFFGGMAYERARGADAQARFFAERGLPGGGETAFGPQGQGGGMPEGAAQVGRGLSGTIASLEGDRLELSTAQDVIIVQLDESTRILRQVEGRREELQPGVHVAVVGARDVSGTLRAQTIQLLQDGAP